MRIHWLMGAFALGIGLSAGAQTEIFARPAATGRYKDIVDQMNQLHNQYPGLTQIYSIGQNNDGVDIEAMRVSVTPGISDPKKIAYLFISTHHGNEGGAPTFTMYFLEQLLKRYQSAELYRTNLAETEWVFVPVLNISGYNDDRREEHGLDPNRQYPGPCIPNNSTTLKSIQLAQALAAARVYAASITVHGYAAALTYPWGVDSTNTHTQDDNAYERITAKAASLNGYHHGTSTDIVYPCDGAFEDYVYWKHGIWSLLLELKDGSPQDIKDTEQAVYSWFSEVDSSPSVKNQMTGQCSRRRTMDVRAE